MESMDPKIGQFSEGAVMRVADHRKAVQQVHLVVVWQWGHVFGLGGYFHGYSFFVDVVSSASKDF